MTGKGKGQGGKGKAKGGKGKLPSSASTTLSAKAGLQVPAARVKNMMRTACHQKRISPGAAIFVAAVLEYMSAEILELAGNAARANKRTTISNRHIALAIQQDEELDKLLTRHATIAGGGVVPHIHKSLVPKKKTKAQ